MWLHVLRTWRWAACCSSVTSLAGGTWLVSDATATPLPVSSGADPSADSKMSEQYPRFPMSAPSELCNGAALSYWVCVTPELLHELRTSRDHPLPVLARRDVLKGQ